MKIYDILYSNHGLVKILSLAKAMKKRQQYSDLMLQLSFVILCARKSTSAARRIWKATTIGCNHHIWGDNKNRNCEKKLVRDNKNRNFEEKKIVSLVLLLQDGANMYALHYM